MDISASRPHFAWIDLVRIISVFWVIQIHVAQTIIFNWGEVGFWQWAAADVYDALARTCVPLFFMVSGYLLLNKQESLTDFFSRRFRKVVIPFIIWSAFYWFWLSDVRPDGLGMADLARTFFPRLLAGPTIYHLWFLYPLLGFYLLVPAFRILVAHAPQRILWYLIGFWFATASLLPLLEKFTSLIIAPEFGFVASYLGYFLLGYLLGQKDYPARTIWIGAAAYVLISALMAYGTFDLTRKYQILDDYWFSLLSPLVITQSGLVFAAMKAFSKRYIQEGSKAASFLKHLAETTFGVYLVHVASLEWLRQIGAALFKVRFTAARLGDPWYSIPLITVTAFLFSFGLVRIMRRVPLLKEVVP